MMWVFVGQSATKTVIDWKSLSGHFYALTLSCQKMYIISSVNKSATTGPLVHGSMVLEFGPSTNVAGGGSNFLAKASAKNCSSNRVTSIHLPHFAHLWILFLRLICIYMCECVSECVCVFGSSSFSYMIGGVMALAIGKLVNLATGNCHVAPT